MYAEGKAKWNGIMFFSVMDCDRYLNGLDLSFTFAKIAIGERTEFMANMATASTGH